MTSKLLFLIAIGTCFGLGAAHAQQAKTPTAQQTKMATCNQEAGDRKGDERKAFMKTCLSAKPVTQQDKMKNCNADPRAKTLKGDDRKAFMKECLSAKPAA